MTGPPCRRSHGTVWLVDGSSPGDAGLPATPGPDDGLLGAGRVVGAARWVAIELFAAVGAWAADDACPAAAVAFAVAARQFAWHADLLADRLPVLAGVDPAALTVAPAGWEALGEVLAVDGTEDRLVVLGRIVLPRLVVARARWLSRTGSADAALRRALRLVLADEQQTWVSVEALALDHGVDDPAAAAVRAVVPGLSADPFVPG